MTEHKPVKEVNIKLRIDVELHKALQRIATQNEGTVAAEMRKALRSHVRKNKDLMLELKRLGIE